MYFLFVVQLLENDRLNIKIDNYFEVINLYKKNISGARNKVASIIEAFERKNSYLVPCTISIYSSYGIRLRNGSSIKIPEKMQSLDEDVDIAGYYRMRSDAQKINKANPSTTRMSLVRAIKSTDFDEDMRIPDLVSDITEILPVSISINETNKDEEHTRGLLKIDYGTLDEKDAALLPLFPKARLLISPEEAPGIIGKLGRLFYKDNGEDIYAIVHDTPLSVPTNTDSLEAYLILFPENFLKNLY